MIAKPLSKHMIEKYRDKIFNQAPAGALICVKVNTSFLYYTVKLGQVMIYVPNTGCWAFSSYANISELLKDGDWVYLVEKQDIFPE